jgi:hypothetical protein
MSQSHLQSKSNITEVVAVSNLLERQLKFLQGKEDHLKKLKEDASFTHVPKINDKTTYVV